ncbi:hypothetical protein UT300005_29020 [Clostridium sp. CTA-5]
MKGFIIDSTFKEDVIVGLNDFNTIVPCNNISDNTKNGQKIQLSTVSSNYISHANKSNKYNIYNLVDYL